MHNNEVKEVRLAVVGTGWWASDVHIPAVLAREDARLLALCDRNVARLEAASANYGISASYADLDMLLKSETLDGVIVATSNASHYAVVKTCLEQNLAVLVEKPMTLKAREGRNLLELACTRRLELMTGYPYNLTPVARRIREVLGSGELGAIQYINGVFNSYMTPFFGGDFPFDYAVHKPTQYDQPGQIGGGHGQVQLPHWLGLMFFLTQLKTERVAAFMAHHQFKIDLVDAMTVAFANGALATLGGSGNHNGHTFRLVISCEKGWVDMDAGLHKATIKREDAELETLCYQPEDSISGGTTQHFIDVLLGKAVNSLPADGAVRAVEVLEAAYCSAAKEGMPVDVKELYED